MTGFSRKDSEGFFIKPYIVIPLFALFIFLSMFIPRIIQQSYQPNNISLWRRPDLYVNAYICNDTVYINITYSGNESLYLIHILAGKHKIDLGREVNGNMLINFTIGDKLPYIIVLRMKYNGREFNRYIHVKRECYK